MIDIYIDSQVEQVVAQPSCALNLTAQLGAQLDKCPRANGLGGQVEQLSTLPPLTALFRRSPSAQETEL